MAAQPKRKVKPMLTLIPEEERAINYRYTIVLVGEGAREFARVAAESEMAEAYKPKSAKPKPAADEAVRDDVAVEEKGQQQLPDNNGHKNTEVEADKFVLFCPTGPNTKELARLRLHPCVGFSDSLPLSTDMAAAKNIIVALLFWQVKHGDADATEDTIREWYSRMAEINHVPVSCRPYTVILAFEADEEQEEKLQAFTERQAGKVEAPKVIGDSGEDAIMESLHDLAEAAIERQKTVELKLSSSSGLDAPQAVSKSKGCSVL